MYAVVDGGFFEGSAILIQFFEFLLYWNGKCDASERLWLTAFAERGILVLFARVESSRAAVLNSLVNDVGVIDNAEAQMSHHNVNEVSFRLLNTLCHSYPSFILSSIPTIKVGLVCFSHADTRQPHSADAQRYGACLRAMHPLAPAQPPRPRRHPRHHPQKGPDFCHASF